MFNSSESIFYDSPKSLDENYGFWNAVLLAYFLLSVYWILLHVRAVFLEVHRSWNSLRFWEWHISGVISKVFIFHDALLLTWCFLFSCYIGCHFFETLQSCINLFYVLSAIFYVPLMMLTEFWFIFISSWCIMRTYIGKIPSRTCEKLKTVAHINADVILIKYGLFLFWLRFSADEWSKKEKAQLAFILQLPTQILLGFSTLYHFKGYIFKKRTSNTEPSFPSMYIPFNLYGVFITKILLTILVIRCAHWSGDDADLTVLSVFLDHIIAAIVIQLSESEFNCF